MGLKRLVSRGHRAVFLLETLVENLLLVFSSSQKLPAFLTIGAHPSATPVSASAVTYCHSFSDSDPPASLVVMVGPIWTIQDNLSISKSSTSLHLQSSFQHGRQQVPRFQGLGCGYFWRGHCSTIRKYHDVWSNWEKPTWLEWYGPGEGKLRFYAVKQMGICQVCDCLLSLATRSTFGELPTPCTLPPKVDIRTLFPNFPCSEDTAML